MCWSFDVKCILGLVARLCALPAVTEAAKLFHTSDVRTLRQQWQPTLFLGAFGKLRKATTSFIMCVCPSSVLLEQLGPHRTDFHEIWYLSISFSGNNNKMQLCNRIYYSKVYWRLNMFRAARRSRHVEPSINFWIINSITSCILLVFLPSQKKNVILCSVLFKDIFLIQENKN